MLIGLLSADYFDETGHHHLPVGHTHEDIDGVFGLLSITSYRPVATLSKRQLIWHGSLKAKLVLSFTRATNSSKW